MQPQRRLPVNSVADDLSYLLRQFRNTFSETGGESPVSFSHHLHNIDYKGIPLDLVEALAYQYSRVDNEQFITIVLMHDAAFVDN